MKKLLASLGALCLLVSSVSGLSVNVTAGNAPQALMLQAFDGTVGDSYTYTWGGTSAITELTYTETGAVSGTALQATLKQGSDASDAAQGLQLRLGNPADGSYDEVREQAASKKYLMWHINVSDVPEESRREDFTDAAGNPCFGVYVTLITSDAWYQHNGGYTGRVELMPDAGGWTTGVTSGEWICLPYGFSGWVRTELSDYKGMWEDDPAMDLNKIQDYLYLTFSQMNSDVMVQVDSLLMANDGDAIEGFEEPAAAVEIQDFGSAPLYNNSVWGVELADGVEAVESVEAAVSGPYGCEIRTKADADDQFYSPNIVGAVKNLEQVKTKKYVALHITVPDTPTESRDPNVCNDQKEPCIAFSFSFRADSSTGAWSFGNNGGARFSDRAEALVDGEAAWSRVLTKGTNVYIPYGFSGWIRMELDNFIGKDNGGAPIDRTKILETWDLSVASVSKATSVLVDAIYAADAADLLPGCSAPMGEPVPSEDVFANQAVMLQSFDSPGEDGDLYNKGIWAIEPVDEVEALAAEDAAVDGDDYGCAVTVKDSASADTAPYLVLESKQPVAASGKRYWLFHIVVPDVPEAEQSNAFVDPNGTRYFGVRVTARTDNGQGGYWAFDNNGGYFRDRVEVLADGESEWKRGVSKNEYACLPYGFSGWVKLDLENYVFMDDKTTPIDTTDGKLRDAFDVFLSPFTGTVELDAFYAANKGEYVPGLQEAVDDMVPSTAGERKEAAVVQDFEEAGASGDNVADSGKAFWGSDGVEECPITAELDASHAVNGGLACKLYSTDGSTLAEPNLVGQMVDLDGTKGKRYIAFHITIPENPSEKLDDCFDVDGNLYFGISLGFRTAEERGTTWWILNGDFFKDKAELFVDGGSEWVKGLTKDSMIFLPFGYSGWVRVDLQDYFMRDTISEAKLDPAKLLDIFDITFSQVNGEEDALYLDAFFAMNDEDSLPGLKVTEGGSNDAGYPQKGETNDETDDDAGKEPQPSVPDDTKPDDGKPDDYETPNTGVGNGTYPFALLAAGAVLALGWTRRIRRGTGVKEHDQ